MRALLRVSLLLLLWGLGFVLISRWRAARSQAMSRELRRAQRLVRRLERRWLRAEGVGGRDTRVGGQAMTLLLLARRAAERDAAQSAAPEAIELYYAARFGGEPTALGLQAELQQLLRVSRRRRARTALRSAARH